MNTQEPTIRFDGRAILITGAGRGIGREVALLLASRGARVALVDNGAAMDGDGPDASLAESVAADIRAAGGEAIGLPLDLTLEAAVEEAVAATVQAFGRLDGLLHSASTSPPNVPPDHQTTRDLELVLRINAFAGLWLARAAWPHMTRQSYGRIVYMTSAAIYGAPGCAAYAAAKGASIGMTRSLAVDGAKAGLCVNAVSPSAFTRMTNRLPPSDYRTWLSETMTSAQVAVGVAFLLSEACSLTGEVLALGGGRIARLNLAESEGQFAGGSIEQVRDAIPEVLTQGGWLFPRDLAERSAAVARQFHFATGK